MQYPKNIRVIKQQVLKTTMKKRKLSEAPLNQNHYISVNQKK